MEDNGIKIKETFEYRKIEPPEEGETININIFL